MATEKFAPGYKVKEVLKTYREILSLLRIYLLKQECENDPCDWSKKKKKLEKQYYVCKTLSQGWKKTYFDTKENLNNIKVMSGEDIPKDM